MAFDASLHAALISTASWNRSFPVMAPPPPAPTVASNSRKRQASSELEIIDDEVLVMPVKRTRRDEQSDVPVGMAIAMGNTTQTEVASSSVKDQLRMRRERLARAEAGWSGLGLDETKSAAVTMAKTAPATTKSDAYTSGASASTAGSSSSTGELATTHGSPNPIAISAFIAPSPPAASSSKLHSRSPQPDDTVGEIARLKMELATKNALIQRHQDTFSALQSSLQCQICYEVMHDPYISPPPAMDNNAAADLLAPQLRRKTCPTCRAPIRTRPTPVFIVKNVITNLIDHIEGAPPPPPPNQPHAIEGVGAAVRDDPWAGLIFGGNNDQNLVHAADAWGANQPLVYGNPVYEPPVQNHGAHLYQPPQYVPNLQEVPGVIDDPEDRVQRCGDCLYEIFEGACVGCGRVFFGGQGGGGGFDEDEDDVELIHGEEDEEDADEEEDDFVRGGRRRHWFFGDQAPNHDDEEEEDGDSDGASFIDDADVPQWQNDRPHRDYDRAHDYELPDEDNIGEGHVSDVAVEAAADYGDGEEIEENVPPQRMVGRLARRPIVISDGEEDDAPPPHAPRMVIADEDDEDFEPLHRAARYHRLGWNSLAPEDEDEDEPDSISNNQLDGGLPVYPFSPPHHRRAHLHDDEWGGAPPGGEDDFIGSGDENEGEEEDDFVPRRHRHNGYEDIDDDDESEDTAWRANDAFGHGHTRGGSRDYAVEVPAYSYDGEYDYDDGDGEGEDDEDHDGY
ncbi:hypothetical protein FRB96_002277 [Tulasnella sp. 330]|nr:hypothetical protein FRB96_002277 [Tulasnella sp. 330]